MKYPALFSSKDKSKNIKVSSAAILLGTLRVKCITKFDHISSKFTTPAYIPLTLPALTFRKVVFDPPLPPPPSKKKKRLQTKWQNGIDLTYVMIYQGQNCWYRILVWSIPHRLP